MDTFEETYEEDFLGCDDEYDAMREDELMAKYDSILEKCGGEPCFSSEKCEK